MQIIKHCKENLPEIVTGQLLGLNVNSSLEVTNSYPLPIVTDDTEDNIVEYQTEMLRCLREVNVDNNTVGWYLSTFIGSFLNVSVIETQYEHQSNIKKSVVIVYDPLKTSQGALSLKAYRLTDKFMKLYREQSFTQQK